MLTINQVVESVFSDELFKHPARVVWMNRASDIVILFTLHEPYKAPWSMRLHECEAMLKAEKLRVVTMRLPAFMLQSDDELSQAAKAARDRGWNLIRPLLEGDDRYQIYIPGKLGPIVKAYAITVDKDKKSIFRLLYRYWAYGMSPNALIGQFANSGAPGVQREFIKGKKPGRPPKYLGEVVESSSKLLTQQDKEFIVIGYALFMDNKVKHITDAYFKMLNRFYRAEIPSPDGSAGGQPLKYLDQIPSYDQFSYWGKKVFDDMDVRRGRKGETKWAMNDRAISGNAHHELQGPCHRFEIDATIADVYLVSRFNRNWIIGRPVVYVVIDVKSRMIVGVHVGLEGPSWNIARHALFNAFTDKVSYCAQFGIAIDAGDWPCEHLPWELVADRGEMLSGAAECGIVSGLYINLAILPPFRADWKGTVERSFRTLHDLTQIKWQAGGIKAREKERGQRDYRLDATLDLYEFTRIIIKSVLHWNHHSRDPARLSKLMIEQSVEPTPIAIWNWAAEHDLIEANVRSREEIYLHLLPQQRGTVQAGGIFFKGMFYTNTLDPSGKRSARARANGREAIDVWYEPIADYIWIKDPSGAFVKCPLRGTESKCQGMRVEEVEDMLAITGAVSPDSKFATLSSRVDLDEFIESTLATAIAEKEQAKVPMTKSDILRDIHDKRSIERDLERLRALSQAPGGEMPATQVAAVQTSAAPQEYGGERGAEVISLLSRVARAGAKK